MLPSKRHWNFFTSECDRYLQYHIDEMVGSRGLHGSSVSEQNHYSSLCHLNDTKTPDNQYCQEPMTLIKDLFAHQFKLNLKMRKTSFGVETELTIEMQRLREGSNLWRNQQLMKAAAHSCLVEYHRFKQNYVLQKKISKSPQPILGIKLLPCPQCQVCLSLLIKRRNAAFVL